jgi:hypothetical protein
MPIRRINKTSNPFIGHPATDWPGKIEHLFVHTTEPERKLYQDAYFAFLDLDPADQDHLAMLAYYVQDKTRLNLLAALHLLFLMAAICAKENENNVVTNLDLTKGGVIHPLFSGDFVRGATGN